MKLGDVFESEQGTNNVPDVTLNLAIMIDFGQRLPIEY